MPPNNVIWIWAPCHKLNTIQAHYFTFPAALALWTMKEVVKQGLNSYMLIERWWLVTWIRQKRPMEPDVSVQIIIQHKPPWSWCYHWGLQQHQFHSDMNHFDSVILWFCFYEISITLPYLEDYKLRQETKASPWQFYSLIQPPSASTDAEKIILLPQNQQSLQEMLCRTNRRGDIFSRDCLNPCIMCKHSMWWLYHPLFQQHKDPFIFCLLGWE